MNAIRVIPNADITQPLRGTPRESVIAVQEGICFARIPCGTTSGKSTVGIIAKLPDGKTVFLECTMANFLGAAEIFKVADKTTAN